MLYAGAFMVVKKKKIYGDKMMETEFIIAHLVIEYVWSTCFVNNFFSILYFPSEILKLNGPPICFDKFR